MGGSDGGQAAIQGQMHRMMHSDINYYFTTNTNTAAKQDFFEIHTFE